MEMATVCQVVRDFEVRRDQKRTPGGPCLLPLGADQLEPGRWKEIGEEFVPDKICGPNGQHGEDLEPPRLGGWPSEDVVYHGCDDARERRWMYICKRTEKQLQELTGSQTRFCRESDAKFEEYYTSPYLRQEPGERFRDAVDLERPCQALV